MRRLPRGSAGVPGFAPQVSRGVLFFFQAWAGNAGHKPARYALLSTGPLSMEIHRRAIRSCAVTRTLTTLGERWTLLLLREAIHGLVRFDQFEKSLGISPTTLSRRLRALVRQGLLEGRDTGRSGRQSYHLTERGRALLPAYIAIKDWAEQWMSQPGDTGTVLIDRVTQRSIAAPCLVRDDGSAIVAEDVVVSASPTHANDSLTRRMDRA